MKRPALLSCVATIVLLVTLHSFVLSQDTLRVPNYHFGQPSTELQSGVQFNGITCFIKIVPDRSSAVDHMPIFNPRAREEYALEQLKHLQLPDSIFKRLPKRFGLYESPLDPEKRLENH